MQFRHIFARHIFTGALLIIFSNIAQADGSDAASNIKACKQAISEGDASKALSYAEQALKQNKNNRDALLCKGRAHDGLGQLNEAVAALQAAEKLSATPMDHMVALTLIGNAQKNAKLYPEALDSYRQSLSITQAAKDKGFERINLNQIGDVLVESNQLDAGLESYLAGNKLSANDNERADNYARIAAVYSRLGKHDLAIENQIKAVLADERAGDQDHQANAYLEMGRIYTAAAQYDKAEKAINKTTKMSKEQGSAFWEAKSYYYLALAKAANGQSPAAKTLLADAQHICEQIGAQELNNQIKQALANLK